MVSDRIVLSSTRGGIVGLPGSHVTIVSNLSKFVITRRGGILLVYQGRSSSDGVEQLIGRVRVGGNRRFVWAPPFFCDCARYPCGCPRCFCECPPRAVCLWACRGPGGRRRRRRRCSFTHAHHTTYTSTHDGHTYTRARLPQGSTHNIHQRRRRVQRSSHQPYCQIMSNTATTST